MATNKKITRVESDNNNHNTSEVWTPSPENKGKAKQLRLFATIVWVLALAAQIGAIWYLLNAAPMKMWVMITLIVVDLIFAITGSIIWKKSNRLDPASKKNQFLFFMQSQLGLITAIIAFLPLVILIFLNKDISGKQKGIIGGIAIVAMLIAGVSGIDFNPPSVEQYTEESNMVKTLMGKDYVYWTKSGSKYHLYDDCQHLKSDRTKEIFEGGSVSDAYAHNSRIKPNKGSLCKTCKNRAMKEKNISEETLKNAGEIVDNIVEE